MSRYLLIRLLLIVPLLLIWPGRPLSAQVAKGGRAAATPLRLPRLPGARPRNIVFILTDDHRMMRSVF